MVLEPKVLDYVKDDTIMFEREPMEQLAKEGQIMCWKHNGFGSVWTLFVTKKSLKNSGAQTKRRGRYGKINA